MEAWKIRTGKTKRSTSFRVGGLGYVVPARSSWREPVIPLWLCVATEEGATRAVAANLRMGNALLLGLYDTSDAVHVPRGTPSTWLGQRLDEAAADVLTIYTAEACAQDPGPRTGTEPGFTFLVLPDRGWTQRAALTPDVYLRAVDEAEAVDLHDPPPPEDGEGMYSHEAWHREWREKERKREREARERRVDPLRDLSAEEQTAVSLLFASYLNARTRCPLLPEPGFAVALLYRLLAAGVVDALPGESGRTDAVRWHLDARLGYGLPLVLSAKADLVESELAKAVAAYTRAVR